MFNVVKTWILDSKQVQADVDSDDSKHNHTASRENPTSTDETGKNAPGDTTPSRRQNLAATVLKYGEEISSKNAEIKQLESEITALNVKVKGLDQLKDEKEKLQNELQTTKQ